MIVALLVLVSAYGIPGATAAHALLFVALAATYGVSGSRRLGLSPIAVARSLGGVVLPVVAQAVTTAVVVAAMLDVGTHPHVSQAVATPPVWVW
jgi:hypothetical protein